ncbi:MAG: DUF2330 domain-containing protein [Polyangiales bacterium]
MASKKLLRRSLCAFALVGASFALARDSAAFCGFYVAPSDQPLYNDATMVALMRDGTRTVISMSNNYKGPAADFAMVVPVPVVLQKENVKTLPKTIFTKLEQLSAPRLVEYWEQDPCASPRDEMKYMKAPMAAAKAGAAPGMKDEAGYGVTIEAKFEVGEYDILVLGAKESDGLERWLVDNKYNIPKGASEALAPYIKEGQKFFVAKVDVTKVARDAEGVALLSPLRFNYETPDFRLPVRLGLLNAQGKQDLIVYTLSKDTRYEVSNYPNVTVPTNLDVADATRAAFAPFYAALLDRTIDKAGGRAIVTEYAWTSTGCDPCPTPPMSDSDVATLGGDVLFGMGPPPEPTPAPSATTWAPPPPTGAKGSAVTPGKPTLTTGASPKPKPIIKRPPYVPPPGGGFYGGTSHAMVLTRLHARYDKTTLTEDLVFKAAPPIVGGREMMSPSADGSPDLEQGSRPAPMNNFQARYVIRHAWEGELKCDHPRRGVWGGKPGTYGTTPPTAATGLASAPRGKIDLATYVLKGLEGVVATKAKSKTTSAIDDLPMPAKRSCMCELPRKEEGIGLGIAGLVALGVIVVARRSTRPL